MNNRELDDLLRSAPVPEREPDYWRDFPGEITRRLRRPDAKVQAPARPRPPLLAWGIGFAAACLAIGFVIGHWHGRMRTADAYALLQNGKVLREVLALFPNRVRAIVQDEHGVQLVLSDQPDVPNSTPFWIKVCERGQCRAVVTFSGQEFKIAGERVEVLADAQGRVMLVGDRLFWSSAEPNRTSANLRIQARPVTQTL
jgi:hypothetical protein